MRTQLVGLSVSIIFRVFILHSLHRDEQVRLKEFAEVIRAGPITDEQRRDLANLLDHLGAPQSEALDDSKKLLSKVQSCFSHQNFTNL